MKPSYSFLNEYLILEEYQPLTKGRPGVCRVLEKATGKELVLKYDTEDSLMDEYNAYEEIGPHSNILEIEEYIYNKDVVYFQVEVGMIDLYNFVKLYGVLGDGLLFKVKESMLKAISHIHSNGYVHCDIKPGNIMLMRDGSVKLFDFGHARSIEFLYEEAPLGTYTISAPEVLTKSLECDVGVDYWSLGASLLFLQNGHFPFNGETVFELLKSMVEQLGAPTEKECPSLFRYLGELTKNPPPMEQRKQILPNSLIGNLLSYDPKNRIES